MFAWLTASIADIKTLRESWNSVRGGWSAARQDAAELLAHRRILVDTQAMTPAGMQTVLRTRVRLTGDTETDILRGWLDTAAPAAMGSSVSDHFRAVAAAIAGFAVAASMERLIVRVILLVGSLVSAVTLVLKLVRAEPSRLIETLLGDRALLIALGLMLFGVLLRIILRWRLRAMFRRGLSGSPAGS